MLALRLKKRRLKKEQRLIREAVQADRIDLQTVSLKIERKTKVRDDDRQRAYRKQLMHKREHHRQMRRYTKLKDAAKQRVT